MPSLFTPNVGKLAALAALTGVDGLLEGAKVALSQADFDAEDPGLLRAGLTLPTYVGYAQKLITWLAPSIADDGTPEVVGTVPEFRPTNSVTPNSIFGGAVVTAADALHAAFKLDTPAPMASAMDSMVLTVRLRYEETGLVVVVS